jgi:hypothetical protein
VAEELMPPVEGGFGCFMYQYQELTLFLTLFRPSGAWVRIVGGGQL